MSSVHTVMKYQGDKTMLSIFIKLFKEAPGFPGPQTQH